MSVYLSDNPLTIFGTRSTAVCGRPGPLNQAPSFSPFSFVSGGYQLMSAGLPSKKSGMKTAWWLATYVRYANRPDNLTLVFVALVLVGENVGALERLWEEAEDVGDE